jgi:hypothetical protein
MEYIQYSTNITKPSNSFKSIYDQVIVPEATYVMIDSYISEDDEPISLPLTLVSIERRIQKKMKEITLPDSLRYIGDVVFFNSEATKITLPKHIISIGKNAFAQKRGFFPPKSIAQILGMKYREPIPDVPIVDFVYIPDSIKYIGENAFYGVVNVSVPSTYNSDTDIGAVNIIKRENSKTHFPIDEYDVALVYTNDIGGIHSIPEGVTYLDENSFDNISDIDTIYIPYTVRIIKKGTFDKIKPQFISMYANVDIEEGTFDNVQVVISLNYDNFMILQKDKFPEHIHVVYRRFTLTNGEYIIETEAFDDLLDMGGVFDEFIDIDDLPETCFDVIQYDDENSVQYIEENKEDNIIFVFGKPGSYVSSCFSKLSLLKFLNDDHTNVFVECNEGTNGMLSFNRKHWKPYPLYFRIPLSITINVNLQEIINIINSDHSIFYVQPVDKTVERSVNFGVIKKTTNVVSAYHCQEGSGFKVSTIIPVNKFKLHADALFNIISKSSNCKDILNIAKLNRHYRSLVKDNVEWVYDEMKKSGMIHNTFNDENVNSYQKLVNICLESDRLNYIDEKINLGFNPSNKFFEVDPKFNAALLGREQYNNYNNKLGDFEKYKLCDDEIKDAFMNAKLEYVMVNVPPPIFDMGIVYTPDASTGNPPFTITETDDENFEDVGEISFKNKDGITIAFLVDGRKNHRYSTGISDFQWMYTIEIGQRNDNYTDLKQSDIESIFMYEWKSANIKEVDRKSPLYIQREYIEGTIEMTIYDKNFHNEEATNQRESDRYYRF